MPRRLIKRLVPSPERIASLPMPKRLVPYLSDPHLWYLNRHTVSGAMYWGLFCAFLPIPMQFLPAALGAIFFRVNLPLCIALVWLSNPLTMLPIVYIAYAIGAAILGVPMLDIDSISHLFGQWIDTLLRQNQHVTYPSVSLSLWPLALGLLIEAILVSVIGGLLTQVLWRCHVIHCWKTQHSSQKP